MLLLLCLLALLVGTGWSWFFATVDSWAQCRDHLQRLCSAILKACSPSGEVQSSGLSATCDHKEG